MPAIFLFIILIVATLVFVKSILFWVYLWQVKEYRLDRFLAEYGDVKKIFRFWVGSGGRKIYKPKWTTKAALICIISFLLIEAASILTPFNPQLVFIYVPVFYILLYLLLPPLIYAVVLVFKIPTFFAKRSLAMQASRKIKKMKNLLVIGITGSYGKSSTKEFLGQILAHRFKVVKTAGNVNSELGVFRFVLENLPVDTEIFIVEIGAYKIGEIREICKVVRPKIGILTGVSEQHLALFGSLENTKKAKFELIGSLPKDGVAFFNGENKLALELAEKWQGKGIIYRSSLFPITKKLPRHYELNLSGAMDVARYLDMSTKEIDEAVKAMDFDAIVSSRYTGRNGALIINDTYSANPDGVLAALDLLASEPQHKRIIIMPCLIELGRAATEIHQKIGHKINDICDLAIITTYDYFKDIKKGAGDGFDKLTTSKVVFENSLEGIKSILDKKLSKDTAVLLEGRLPTEIIAYASGAAEHK